ncbi:MAG: CPBP family intramembrane metalloprotease [Bacteroidales bacterium]|nr:MAG: CPBP family intramembrane metalloprotease [Bacteroidales bacterium]
MDSIFIWEQDYFKPVTSLSVALICFLFYHFITNSDSLYKKFQITFGENRAQEFWIHFRQVTGFIFLGGIPLLVVLLILQEKTGAFGLSISMNKTVLYYIVIISVIIVFINFFASKNHNNQNKYPLIRTKKWNLKLLIISMSGWIIYLLAYEFLFRGFLLFACIQSLGIWPAIIINIVYYSLAHVPQGLNEAVGAIPFGLVLCYVVVLSGTIWPAFLLHTVLAISNEWFSISNNAEITFRFSSSDQTKLK